MLFLQDEDYSDNSQENMFSSYTYDYGDDYQYVPATWPTHSGITEDQARAACQGNLAESPALDTCGDLVDTGPLIESCIMDVKVYYNNIM